MSSHALYAAIPPVIPRRMQAMAALCLCRRCESPRRECDLANQPPTSSTLLLVGVLDLVLGDFLQGHGQVVLRARLDERRRGFLEAHALTELVVIVVDLPRPLRRHDHERVARVDAAVRGVEELIDAGVDHGRAMVAASASSRS